MMWTVLGNYGHYVVCNEKFPSNSPNYWFTANAKNKDYMLVDLGCNVEVLGFKVKNTHNSLGNDFSTKKLKVELKSWDTLIDNELFRKDLPNSIDKVNLS